MTHGNPLDPPLDAIELRALGALLEKERTTPDGYPLSLNGLTAACNQSSNRDPVMSLDEPTVSAAVDRLRRRALVKPIVRSGARVTTYAQRAGDELGLVNRQLALLCVLMLRGPQTVAELRTRAQRLHDFEDVADVESTLDGLIAHEPAPLVVRLPRRPGQKETRYAHLLGGEVSADALDDVGEAADARPRAADRAADRVAALEDAVAALREETAALRAELAEFRRQFE